MSPSSSRNCATKLSTINFRLPLNCLLAYDSVNLHGYQKVQAAVAEVREKLRWELETALTR